MELRGIGGIRADFTKWRRERERSKELEYALAPRIGGLRILHYFVHVFTNGIFELAHIDRMWKEPVVDCILWVYHDLEACAFSCAGPEDCATGASFDCDVVVEDHGWIVQAG